MGKITDEMNPAKPEPTEEIQEEIRQTESEISHTLSTIEERLSPKHLKQEMKSKLKHYTLAGVVKVTEACKRKPIPAALIGVGALVFLVRRLTTGRHRKRSLATGAAKVVEAMPEQLKKRPVKTTKNYVTLARVVVAVASTLGTMFLKQRDAMGRQRPPVR